MKKRIAAVLLSALFLFALPACAAGTDPEESGSAAGSAAPGGSAAPESSRPTAAQPGEGGGSQQAEPAVCRVKLMPGGGDQLLVTDWGDGGRPIGLCSVSVQNARIVGLDGETVTADALRPGMVLDITWNGLIQESFPGMFAADEVQAAAQGDDLVGLYRQAVSELWDKTGQKAGVERLGLDFSGLTNLSEGERTALAYLSACGLELSFGCASGTWEELTQDGFAAVDGDGYWTDGMMLSLSLYHEEADSLGFTAVSSRADGGAVLVLTCTADRQEDGTWSYWTIEPSGT